MANWIIIMLLLYGTTILIRYYGDYIMSTTRLMSCKSLEAEIVDCQYMQSLKGGKYVTIATYLQNGKAKDVILSYVQGDKTGDRIEIVTDGNCAVRSRKIHFTRNDIIKLLFTGLFAVGLGFFAYMKLGMIPVWLVLVVVGLCVSSIVLYPLYVVSRSYDIKIKLGWIDATEAKSLQQEIDDKLLIGVCVGAFLILFVAVQIITNS